MAQSDSGKDLKSPTLFGRAKEELEAILHKEKTHHKETHGTSNDIDEDTPIDKVKGPSIFERAKEEMEALIETIHTRKEPPHKETHGTSNGIDADTPIDKVKGPNVFERAKEEIEALVQTIHTKKEPDHKLPTEREGGCWPSLGRTLEHICSPSNGKKD